MRITDFVHIHTNIQENEIKSERKEDKRNRASQLACYWYSKKRNGKKIRWEKSGK